MACLALLKTRFGIMYIKVSDGIAQLKGGLKMDNQIEIGRVKRDDQVDIILRRGEYMGKEYYDLREYLTAESFQGFTKRGIRVPVSVWPDLDELFTKVKKSV